MTDPDTFVVDEDAAIDALNEAISDVAAQFGLVYDVDDDDLDGRLGDATNACMDALRGR